MSRRTTYLHPSRHAHYHTSSTSTLIHNASSAIMTADHLITDPTLLSVLRAAEEARRQCLELTDLIAQNHAEEPSDEQFDAQRKLNARLALLRGLNRNAVKSVRTTKQETTEARQEIDSLHLELQNLYYEQGHLRGEIRGCEGFE